jgi:uncharacterized protein (TIGR03000 family)
MLRSLAVILVLTVAALIGLPTNAPACECAGGCFVPCCCIPFPLCDGCFCLAWADPYHHKGALRVWCPCCPSWLPHWSYCYIYRGINRWDWVKVFRCFSTYEEADKAAKAQEEHASLATGSAELLVTLPEEAKLKIDGRPTTATSAERAFLTPPLQAGRDYHYNLTASFPSDVHAAPVTRRVTVRPGEITRVDLNFSRGAVAAPLSASAGSRAVLKGNATVRMILPTNARLLVNGDTVATTSSTPVFTAPELESGQVYFYTFEVVLAGTEGESRTTKQVHVRAGDDVHVDLSEPARNTRAPNRSGNRVASAPAANGTGLE